MHHDLLVLSGISLRPLKRARWQALAPCPAMLPLLLRPPAALWSQLEILSYPDVQAGFDHLQYVDQDPYRGN